ncbi:MAG TPA: hypothetical protein VFJ71_09880 [Candidatus Limnocylindrales bacterium]|nr:hypothetical protein [Candidatus Limnocylindrales bacterium]
MSPLQSAECVYYRSLITEAGEGDGRDVFREDRAVGFRVRDPSGSIRVFPRGARFDVPERYDATSDALSDAPGLRPRIGPVYAPGPDDRESRITALLTVRAPGAASLIGASGVPLGASHGRRHYREARIEPGDIVTVIGRALPFSDLSDPTEANVLDGGAVGADDPEIAGDIAEARAAGLLEDTPEEAWGNAAIPGFGIGRPVRTPELDPRADALPLGTPEAAARAEATFAIAPETLVLGSANDMPLAIALGAPTAVAARGEWQFLVGLFGAIVAIAGAMTLALVLNGTIR